MRIMITGGGTGGHTSPAAAVIEELRARDPQLLMLWVGKRGGIEQRVAAAYGIPFRGVPAAGWPRKRTIRRLWVAARMGWATVRCMLMLRKFRPQAVFGVGGYVSLPLMLAAQRLGVPTVLHEQNKRLGMANRMAAPKAARVFLSYEDTIGEYPKDRARVVGNPVRHDFVAPPDRAKALDELGLRDDVPVVLVCGGSQGARSINTAVANLLPGVTKDEAQFIWMTGKDGVEDARAAAKQTEATVQVHAFIDEMARACVAADVVVTRAGASTTAELAALGKPAILIPYPHATDNHQDKNAEALEAAGTAVRVPDAECDNYRLARELRALLTDPGRLESMAEAARGLAKPLAAETIAEAIMMLVFEQSQPE